MECIWVFPRFVLSSAARAVDTAGIWSVVYNCRFVSPRGVLQVFLRNLKEHTPTSYVDGIHLGQCVVLPLCPWSLAETSRHGHLLIPLCPSKLADTRLLVCCTQPDNRNMKQHAKTYALRGPGTNITPFLASHATGAAPSKFFPGHTNASPRNRRQWRPILQMGASLLPTSQSNVGRL